MSNQDSPRAKPIKLAVKSPTVDRFQPLLRRLAERDELNEVLKNRVEKAVLLVDAGVELYPNEFSRDADVSVVLAACADLPAPEDVPEGEPAKEAVRGERVFSLAGRVMSLRSFGKAAFFTLQDAMGRMQVYVQRDALGPDAYALFKKLDIGDIVGVKGRPFLTKTGEPTVDASEVRLLSKSMRPLPEKYHGLKDVETRYRQRYVDLIVTPRAREIFRKRTAIVGEMRRFLDERGFMEVETPMMQPIPGGATARPFVTHHNTLDMRLYMRIAPELYLKRLLVGGFEKVYEINRNFRNEGISTQHNPEFTMCEFYWAYANFRDLMDLTEQMFSHIARVVTGDSTVVYQGQEIKLAAPWQRLTFHESLEKIGGIGHAEMMDYDTCKALVRMHGETAQKGEKLGKIQAKLFDLLVEPKLIQPTFIYHYPTDISPLSRRNQDNPDLTDRYELFITGREMANAFSELNDPIDQRQRFEEQVKEKEAGDDEAHFMDEDYVRALEYGMPPAAGQGIGIDRLVMLLTDSASIREVILFPLLRLESGAGS